MRALDCFHVQIIDAFLLKDSGILAVGQRARDSVAKTGDVVLVSAKVLLRLLHLHLEGAILVVEAVPQRLIVMHREEAE